MMVQQGEGGGGGGGGTAVKSRRNGARLFKNPPQPHMCIQDYIQGSWDPCYVNVLSWGKIAMPHRPSEPVPLWGGMKISSPRTEKPQCAVFAVMANPEILRLNGKNAQDPQERSALIDLLLDFVEAMNEGVVFTRCYTVLKDRDITGELKEVWMAVQVKRDKEQESQQETWIDVRPPAPQYPQFEISPDYSYQPSAEQQVYQSNAGHMVAAQQYHAGGMGQEQYSYGERGRSQNQANCPAYPTAQYQFQQLPRQLVPQYINSNIHPGVAPNYGNPGVQVAANVNPNIPGHYQQYIALQQQMVGQRQLENVIHAARENHVTDMQQQHIQHIQSVPQYEQPPPFGMQTGSQINVLRLGRPHMGVTQKSNANKRGQITNSPTHVKNNCSVNGGAGNRQHGNKDTGGCDKIESVKGFRMKVLRDQGKVSNEVEEEAGRSNVQVTDLDDESDETKQSRDKDSQVIENATSQKSTSRQGPGNGRRKELRQQILKSSEEITVLETDLPLEGTEDNAPSQNLGNKPVKTQILVLKRNSAKSSNGDSKVGGKESKLEQQKAAKNAIRLTKLEGQQIYDLECSERLGAGAKEDHGAHDSGDKKIGDLSNGSGVRNGYAQQKNHKDNNRPKRSHTVNNIIKNVFKIHPSTSASEDKDRVNNQVKFLNGKSGDDNNDDEVYHGYAILRKGDPNQDDVVNEIAKISIQDCKESNENGTLGS